MTKILLDPGHGAGPAHNRGFIGGNEGDNNYTFALKLKAALGRYGIVVGMTRSKITDDPSLATRGKMGAGYDLFLSVHSNAGGGTGAEVYDDVNPKYSNKALAAKLSATCATVLCIKDRGVKYKYNGKSNWYGVLYNNAAKNGMLMEMFFHDNSGDVAKFKANEQRLADALAQTLAEYYGSKPIMTPPTTGQTPSTTGQATGKTPIMHPPTTTVEAMQDFARSKNANPLFVELAPLFFDISVKYGVDPAVTYAQAAKETGYMRFCGVLDASYCNPCGLKTTQGGGDKDKSAHMRFASWQDGITAQVEHLKLYAGYATPNNIDPRHFLSIKGTAPYVEDLGGKWAPGADYGIAIRGLMRQMQVADKTVYVTYKNDGDIPTAIALFNALDGAVLIKPDQVQPDMRVISVGGQGANRAETLKIMVNKEVQ